jgi:cytochrome c oxidase cbb3-type subunit 3/ubiquinol-cytochrome c reductase cytochrome c subunit
MLGTVSCAQPGHRAAEAPVIRPSEVADFALLYGQNCSGCHGADGQGALSVGIGRPLYLAIADDATIRRVVEQGRAGTAMQAFAKKAGGMLTAAQIEILVHGIRGHWARPGTLDTANIPAYAASQPGDAERGHTVFAASCSTCHGPEGRGARAIADSSFLALVSDQHLRTVTIVGMPNLGMPDWRGHNKPLSDADVTDVVAWLAAQRQQPLSAQLSH